MEKFSFKRFWNVFHCEYAKMRVFYVSILAMMIAIVFICGSVLMFPKLFGSGVRSFADYFLRTGVDIMYIFAICPGVMFAFSGMNKTMIPELMQPASASEKFWAKFSVYWLIPTLFAFAMIWIFPTMHYAETFDGESLYDANGDRIPMVLVNGLVVSESTYLDEMLSPPRWQSFRMVFCTYLCLSGLMLLGGALFFKKASPQKFGPFIGVITFVVIIAASFVKKMELPDCVQDFIIYIKAESYRITIFLLSLGLSVVAICTAIAYRRFCRLTLK